MTETRDSICEWADATFGVATDITIAARALKEMAELVTACTDGESAEKVGTEIADVVIVLARLGRSMGYDAVQRAQDRCVAVPSAGHIEDLARAAEGWLRRLEKAVEVRSPLATSDLMFCLSCLRQAAHAIGIDLPAAIDAKMAVNRARKWRLDGNGHGQHVEGT